MVTRVRLPHACWTPADCAGAKADLWDPETPGMLAMPSADMNEALCPSPHRAQPPTRSFPANSLVSNDIHCPVSPLICPQLPTVGV